MESFYRNFSTFGSEMCSPFSVAQKISEKQDSSASRIQFRMVGAGAFKSLKALAFLAFCKLRQGIFLK